MVRSIVGRFVLLCLLAACGRVGFATERAAAGDATSDTVGDGPPGIVYVGPVAQRYPGMGPADTFALQAGAAGDAIVMMVACAGSGTPTGVTVTAAGWTFTSLDPLTIDSFAQIAGASFAAIAPDTAATTVSVTWTSNCNRGKTEVADEFASTTGVDVHAAAQGTGNCTTSVTTGHAGDAVWAACYSATTLTSIGAGFTLGATDSHGDYAEYELTSDPAGTVEQISFTNTNGFVVVAAALAPR
jgi:hypothetical protein